MILGLGVDILSLTRIQGVITRRGGQRLAQRILSKRELEEFLRLDHATWTADSHGSRDSKTLTEDPAVIAKYVKYLSPRWAIKEAAYKALPEQLQRTLTWRDLDLRYKPSGAPALEFAPSMSPSKAEGITLMPSLSHDTGAGAVVGVVLAQRE